VKILYVRNLMLTTTEEHLRELFTQACGGGCDCIERVKKIRDYAFVHFRERSDAITAMEKIDAGGVRGGNNIPGYLRDKKPHTELLDDLCARNGLCTPSYQVQSHELLDTVTGAKSNWFLGRVTLANVGNSGPRQYSAFRFTQTTEEARVAAAESALLQLAQPAATVLPDPGQAFV
uniref:RRM domain-containing protein n=1 Tax=Macrostomum lignano TaxID=282301 RepID=A0A1I8IFE5_9PLAT